MANLATALRCNRKTYVRENAFEIMTRLTTMNKISTKVAASLTNDPETPIFIIGTPGNGKSYMIHSICTEFGYEVIEANITDIDDDDGYGTSVFEVDLRKKIKKNPNKHYVLLFDDTDFRNGNTKRYMDRAINMAMTRTILNYYRYLALPHNISICITSCFSLESTTMKSLIGNTTALVTTPMPYPFKIFNLDEGIMD